MACDCDVVIVGGGIGGLTAGLYLARAKQRVLICEQRADPGGFLTATPGPAGRLDVRLPCICSQGVVFPVLAELGLAGGRLLRPADWQLAAPGFQLKFEHLTQVVQGLQVVFPQEAAALEEYGKLLHGAINWLKELFLPHPFLHTPVLWTELVSKVLRKPALAAKMTGLLSTATARFLQRRFSDPDLLRLLGSLGYPRMPALLHAGMWYLFLEDYWLPEGGLYGFTQAFTRSFLAAGGTLLVNSEVDKILVRQNRAYGVELAGGRLITAKHVISAADFNTTYQSLLRDAALPAVFHRRLRSRRPSASYVTVCLMTSMPERLLQKLNTLHTFWFPAAHLPQGMIISAPAGRSGSAGQPLYLSCQYNAQESPAILQTRLLRAAEDLLPGLQQCISYAELWSPARYAREFGAFGGASAGWDLHPFHIVTRGFPGWNSPVRNLYHASQWVYSPGGVPAAMLSARQVSRKILGLSNI